MLADGTFTPPGASSNLLVPVALENKEGHFPLGGGQSPCGKLRVNGHAESGQGLFGTGAPGIPFRETLHKRSAELPVGRSSTSPAAP